MDAAPATLSSEARVAMATPRRYLGQLCKHFQHKLPVTLDERHGHIAFPAGACEAEAAEDDATLVLRVTAADAEALVKLEDVVARHLLRFAFREEVQVDWQRRRTRRRAAYRPAGSGWTTGRWPAPRRRASRKGSGTCAA